MNHIYLEKHDPRKTCIVFINCSLCQASSMIGRWFGNGAELGSPGTVRKEWFNNEDKARNAAELLAKQKSRRGYVE